MRNTLPLALVLLAVSMTSVHGAGLNLRWTSCAGDGGTQNKVFACNTNTANHDMIASFVLDASLAQVNGDELVVDLSTASTSLPDWWRLFNFGSCRQVSLSIAAHDGPACPDMFIGKASMNIASYQVGLHGPNSARILSLNAVQAAAGVDLIAGQEYAVARWRVSSQKTVGLGACDGCAIPACITFNSANLSTIGDANNLVLTTAANPGSNYITWQGGAGTNCPAATPSRNSTWGAVKSLYR